VIDEAAALRLTFADHFRRLYRALGLSQRTDGAVETGAANLTLGSLMRLAQAVGGDVPAMLTKEE
jgi:hypothetical protein